MWYQSKWFYLNLIAIAILVLQYFVANSMFESMAIWWPLIISILNAIAGMIQSGQTASLKRQLNAIKK